ncbi:MAG: TonB-dependent receptor [Sphingomonas bacterium]|uniref:TonB-dependent receptor n=1 Tax=Sphingomonas bacterium TaxID=1895847 RepID=UPI00262784AA|nr:TonB-dependent receptor [Sphingomonas bacterium]MDB5708345.1 TonB-dependent receptor [Sphingomonas bacterium]
MKACAYLLGASALAFAWCGTAAAQTTPPPAASSAPTDSQATDTGTEVVVTAQRRTENLMRTAISASVLSGTDLANKGVVNVDALQFAMPSVVVNNFGQGLEFNVRGIGKAEHNSQTTTGVVTYRDGVPTFPGYFQEEPYFDIANVQVLRGPQGTIVGQNATGGAVFVNTNDPVINGGTHGYFNANYGNYNDAGAQGAINIPVSDTFAARVAFYGERRDSFYHITGPGGAAYTGNKGKVGMVAGRISFLWKPSSQLSILSKTDFDYLDLGAYPADPYSDRFPFLPVGSTTPNPNYRDLFNLTANSPQAARDKFVRTVLKIDYELDSGIKLRSITGFQNGNTTYTADLDGNATGASTFFDSVTETQLSQEFNIISPDNQRFTWLLGGFGLWDTYYFLNPYQFVIGTPPGTPAGEYKLQGRNPTRSLALFGQLGFKITPSLKLDVGGRYTTSRTKNVVDILQYGTYIPAVQNDTSHDFSYKVSLGWAVNPNQYLYGFVATGFRPGGLNVPVGLGLPAPFGPEKVRSYELGWKANFAGGHIRTTIDGFYNDYRNFQVIIGYPAVPVFGIEVNVPNTTKIYGFEADAEFKFGGFSFDAGINVLHSQLGQFYATDPRIAALAACDPATGPASASCLNLKGREQTYAPNFTFNASVQYEFAVGASDKVTPRVSYGHIAPQWATLFENPLLGDRLGDRNIVSAQLAWSHGSWTATAYATNLTNQHYVAAMQSSLDFAGPPRQYGIKVLKTF